MRTILRLALAAGALAALTGCEDGKFTLGQKKPASEGAADATGSDASGGEAAFSLVERDVEAPEAFSLKDKGLWDGRPSLGGVWVAHGSVKDPERVIIRNPSNGKSVVGALFRREVANPGPPLQVSSDAAAALGMLAGQPAQLDVVALRREQPAKPEAAAAAAQIASEGEAAGGAAAGGSAAGGSAAGGIDPIAAGAAAAIARAEGGKADGAKAADGAADAAATDLASADGAAAAKPCPFWRKKKCLAEQAALGAGVAPDEGMAVATGAVAAPGATPGAGAVEVSAIPATPAAAGTLTRPYVQIGIFSVESNAQRAVDQMKAAGMTATVRSDQSQGKKFWRVVIGPVASVAERDGIAARVKAIGYPDAYPVSK